MKSKGNNPTAAELKWREVVADFANESSWLDRKFSCHCLQPSRFEIDHIIGAKAKRKPYGKVGEWAIIPLPYELHNIMAGGKLNRTLNPSAFRNEFGHEKDLFKSLIYCMKMEGYEIPFSDEIVTAIVEG